jgi:hypothetical protein
VGITILLAHEETLSFEFHDDVEAGSEFWENQAYFNFSYKY